MLPSQTIIWHHDKHCRDTSVGQGSAHRPLQIKTAGQDMIDQNRGAADVLGDSIGEKQLAMHDIIGLGAAAHWRGIGDGVNRVQVALFQFLERICERLLVECAIDLEEVALAIPSQRQ